ETSIKNFEDNSQELADYAVLYVRTMEQKRRIGPDDLENFASDQIESLNIRQISKEKLRDSIRFDKFVPFKTFLLLEQYQLNPRSHSAVTVMKQHVNNPDQTTVIILNWLSIQNHLFYCGYYYKYTDSASIEKAKRNNSEIISAILKSNP